MKKPLPKSQKKLQEELERRADEARKNSKANSPKLRILVASLLPRRRQVIERWDRFGPLE